MNGEHPKSIRTGNHERRPKSLLPTTSDNQQNQHQQSLDKQQPESLINAPGPPSGYCTPSINTNFNQDNKNNEPSIDHHLNPTVFYASNVQYANVTPNRAFSMLVGWQEDEAVESNVKNKEQQTVKQQTLNVNNPPPELSVSPADTLSKTSSDNLSLNLSAFSPNLSLSNQPLSESFNRIHSLKHYSRKHRKFKQFSPLTSPIWPSATTQLDHQAVGDSGFNRPSSQPHSPSSLSVNYIPSPARDRSSSYSAGCTSTNFIFPTTTTTAANMNPNAGNSNVAYSSNHSLIETKQNSVGSGQLSPASSINEITVEIEAFEKAIKGNDWRLVKKLLNAHCSNLNRVYSSSSMNLNLIANQQPQSESNIKPTNMRASLFEKLSSDQQQQSNAQQSTTQLPANQSFSQYRAYSAFDAATINKNLRKESADSQLSANLVGSHGRIESPLFSNLLHLAIEHSSLDVVCLLLRSGFSANANNQTPSLSLDVWRRRSDSSHESHHHIQNQLSTELIDASGPLIYNQMGSRLLYSSREQLVPLLSSSPHLLSPSAVPSNGSNSNLFAICNNRMRFSITSEQSSEQNSELSSIGRYSTPPTKLIKMNPSLPYFLKLVRIGQAETRPLNDSNLKSLLSDNKLHIKEFNCCKCCGCRTENLVLSLPRQLSKSTNRKISLDTTHSTAPNRRKSSVSLANVSGIIQHAVQKNVSSLEKSLHHQNQTIMEKSSLNTVGGLQNAGSNIGCMNNTLKGHLNEKSNNKSDLNKLDVCCVSNAFNKHNCCGTRYAANRYHCHCPLKELLLRQKLVKKLTKKLATKKINFSNDLDLNKLEEFIRSTEKEDDEKSEQNLDSIKKILHLHFKQQKHIVNPFEDLKSSSESQDEENTPKLNLNKNSTLNRLLDSDGKETTSSFSSEEEEGETFIRNKEYSKMNSDKSTIESDEDDKMEKDNKKDELNKDSLENRSSSIRKRKKRKRQTKFKDQAPLLIIDEQRRHARRRRKQKKMYIEEAKRCSSEQDSDGQQRIYDYDNYRFYNRLRLNNSSEDTELSDSSVTFDSEQELSNNILKSRKFFESSNKENETSKDEMSDGSISKSELKTDKKEKPGLEDERERRLLQKQLTDSSIKTSLEDQLDDEKQKTMRDNLKSKSTKKHKKASNKASSKSEPKYDTNNYTTYDEFYTREVLYVLPPLFLAVANQNVQTVKELIRFGASVNATDANGCTVLHLLLCQQRINQSLLNLLLGNGAQLSATNLAGVAPIDLALEKSSELIGLQRKMVKTAFSGLINGLEAICTYNELNSKQTMRSQNNQATNNNLVNNIAATSMNSTMITTDTISHSYANQANKDNQLNEKEISHTLASSMTGLTSGIFQSSQSSSNAGEQNFQSQEHKGLNLVSQHQFNTSDQPFYVPQNDNQCNLGIVMDGNSGGSSSGGGHSNQTDKSNYQQSSRNQLGSQLNQSTSNLHPTSELIKKISQKSQEEGSGLNLTSVATLKAANFLRKLKASAKSSKQRKQEQLLQKQQNLLQQQQNELQQQTDVYLCLEEISSDGPSHGSNRFAYSSYYETSSMNNNEEVFENLDNQQIKQPSVNPKKEDDLHSGELHSASTIATNSTSVQPNNTTTSAAGTRRKKSLGKIYNFIEPSVIPSSGLNYIINSIKGTTSTHAPTTSIAQHTNNISHPAKYSLSSKTSNPPSTTGITAPTTSNLKGNRFTNVVDANRNPNSSLVQLDNLFRGAESGLIILMKMSSNIENVPFIMQVFNANLSSIVNIIDRSSNEKLNKMVASLFNRILLTIIEQIETCADSIKISNNLTYSKLFKLSNKIDDQDQQKVNQRKALFTKWATMNENDVFQYVNNFTIGRLSADLSTRIDSKVTSSPNSLLKNFEKLKQFASFKNAVPTANLCKHMKSKISDDLTLLLKMALGCLRGGQSLQYTALLLVNKIIDTLIVYDVAYDRPVRKINSCKCSMHNYNCCKQRASRRNKRKEDRLSARLELSKKNSKIQKQNSLNIKSKRKLNNQKVDSIKKEEEEIDQQKKAIQLAAAATDASLKAIPTKPTNVKRSSIFSAALFGLKGSGSGSDTSKSDSQQTPKQKQKLTGILTANLRRASIKTGLIKESSPSKSEKLKSVEKTKIPNLSRKSESVGSNELNFQINNLNGHPLPNQFTQARRSNPFINKLNKSLLIARAVGKLSKHSALIMHHRQHSSSVESAAEKNLYLAAVAKEDQVNAAKRKRKVRRCTCKTESKSAFELLIHDGLSLLLNVLNNSITLHKRVNNSSSINSNLRVSGSKQLCTPSHRRQCSHHCMALLSARSILYLTSNAQTRKQLVEQSSLKIILSSLDSTNDPQLLTIVLQIVASLALDIQHQKSLMNADFTDALLQLILPSDEWFYTNVSTKYSRYVKHHAARILIYLGLEKRLRNKVYLFDLLEETLIANNLISPQNQPTNQLNKQQTTNPQTNLSQSQQQQQQNVPKTQAQQINSQNETHCTEDSYICITSLPPLNIYRTIENQQILVEKEKFEEIKPTDKNLEKNLFFKCILNELDFEPKLVSSSVEAMVLQMLQQIENRLKNGETEEEIIEIDENIKLGVDSSQFKTIFDIVAQMIQDKQIQKQEQLNEFNQEQNSVFKDSNQVSKNEFDDKQPENLADKNKQDSQGQQNSPNEYANGTSSKQTKFTFTESQCSIDQNTMLNFNQQPPPSIQVDFISSDRSSPRRSSSQRSSQSFNAEEANEATELTKERIENEVNNKLDKRDLKLKYQQQLILNNRQQFFLKTLPICLSPVIILRLLQHRLFGCFNQLWYWQNSSSSHHPSICLSNASQQTAFYHLLNTRANSARSSFASTIGVESFQGLGVGSRSRASSATANSIILPNELIEANLRNRRNVSLTINPLSCSYGLSLSNLNNFSGGQSSSQRTSISIDRSSRQENYRKNSVRSGSNDDQSSLFQQHGILFSAFNSQQQQNSKNQEEILEFQKQLQNIPRNEISPIAAKNFVVGVSAASNQLLINDTAMQARRNTATLFPQTINTSMDSIVVPSRPRSCSMPQQQQEQLNLQSQQQQHPNAAQINQTVSSHTSSNQLSNNQLSSNPQTQANYLSRNQNASVQQIHNLTNQQLQALINQQLQNQNLINQHLQNQFKSQNYLNQQLNQQQQQQQKDKQQNYQQQTDQSNSQSNSLEDKSYNLYTQGSLDSLSLTPLLVYHSQQRNFFDRSLSIAVPEPMIFQQTQFKQLMPSQKPQTSSNQSFAMDASTQSNLNVNCSHSSVSTNPMPSHFTNANTGRLSFSLRSTSGGDAYSLLNNLATNSLNNRFMPIQHRAIFILLIQWINASSQDFITHAHFRKELIEFLNRAKNLGELYLEKVNEIKKSANLETLESYETVDDINEYNDVNKDYKMLQQLIVSGSLLCSKEDVSKLAGIQLRVQEINVQQSQEPQQIKNPNQLKPQLVNQQMQNLSSSQPNSSKTPPSADVFGSFEKPITLNQLINQTTLNNLRLKETVNLSSTVSNQMNSTPLYSSTNTSVKLHPISEYGFKNMERNTIRTSGGRAFAHASRFSKAFNLYGNSDEDIDLEQPPSKASSASALESSNYLASANKKQRSDEFDEENIDDTVFEQEQLEELEDEEILENLDEEEHISEDEEISEELDIDLDEEKVLSDEEAINRQEKSKSKKSKQSKSRLFSSDDFEFECDLTDSERNQIKQKMNTQSTQPAKKIKTISTAAKKRRTSQSSDENLLSPYRRQSVGHSPTNRTNSRPQLINTKRQKKFKNRLHVDAYKRRYSDVFFANMPPVSQPSSRLSNISDLAITGSLSVSSSRPSSAKLDSRPQSALENLLSVKSNESDKQELHQGYQNKLLNGLPDKTNSDEFTPVNYVRNRSPSCAVVPSHYIKQSYQHRESISTTAKKQNKRRGMSLSFTPNAARHLTNQVTRKLSKQLSKLNQSTKNLLNKTSSPKLNSSKAKEHSISIESSKDVARDISEFYSSIETPPSSSIVLGANVLIYPMINSPVQATLNQASLAAVASSRLADSQFNFDSLTSLDKTKPTKENPTNKDGHMFMNQMKKAKNVFRSIIPLQLNTDTFTSSLFDLKECLPAVYYSTKGIDKAIKEQKRKLFHSQIYDDSLELKKLYIQICRRLPTYDCQTFEVKEIIRTRTTRKRISRILALGVNKISLIDASSYTLTRQQKTKELVEWRSGLGSSGDRIQFEFRTTESRNCKWNLVSNSSNSLNNITRTLLNIMMNSLQTSSAFLAKLLNVDESLFILEDQSITNQFQTSLQSKNQEYKATLTQLNQDSINQSNPNTSIGKSKVFYNTNELSTNLSFSNCEELELLYSMLHFPEEVALRLAEVDYDLFYKVTPVDYIQHITLCLNQINLENEASTAVPTSTSNSTNTVSKKTKTNQNTQSAKTYSVQDLIQRFNKISSWVTHLIIIQPTHDDRKAVLSCLIRVAQSAFNMGAFNTSLQIIAGLKCEKIRPFMLCIKNNENPKHLNYLIDALSFIDQSTNCYQLSSEYCDAIQRAFAIRQSFLVPFFGNFVKDLHTIFQSMSSLAVKAYNQATINHINNSSAQLSANPNANLHFGDRRMLDFVFDYNSEDHFGSKISVGSLVNIEKMNAAERVLNNISTFHIHANRRLIDLNKFTKITNNDLCDCINKNTNNINPSNKSINENKDDKSDDQPENTNTISAQCTPDQQNQLNDLHESTSLINFANLTTSASISAGNLNTLASSNTPNAGSMPLSPWATSSTQNFQQQQQQISTICNALQQYNIQTNQPTTTTPLSTNTTTTALGSANRLDNNNNRLGEQQAYNNKISSSQCLNKEEDRKTQHKLRNVFENDSLYDLDHKNNYKPIQPLPYNHGISFIPYSGEQFFSNLNALQLMQHGTTCIHFEEETNRISIVYLQLEQSNSILGWSKAPWSGLKKNYANNFSFSYSKNQQNQATTSGTNQSQSGTTEKQQSGNNQTNAQSNIFNSQNIGSNLTASSSAANPSSSAPASDYTLQLDIEERIMPIILQRFVLPLNPIAINGLEEGFIDLFYVKHLSQSPVNQIDFISVCKRVGLCYSEFNERTASVICLQFGSTLIDNRRALFIMTNRIGKMWSDGLSMVCDQLKKQKELADQRLNWLKFKYLQLYYEGGSCSGPTSPQAIASFGGRKWRELDAAPDSTAFLSSGISPLMYASYLKDESISKSHQQSGSGQSSIDLSGKRASSFAITKLRKKKSTSSLSTIPKDGSPKSRASSGEDLAVVHQSGSSEAEKSKKDRFKMFHKRSSPNLKCNVNLDSLEKKDQINKTTSDKQLNEKSNSLFSQSSSQDESFCSIDSPPIIYTSQLVFQYQEMLRRNLENGLGCCELYTNWSESNLLSKFTSMQTNRAIQLSFIEFFELFKAFWIRSRKDVRDLFDNLSSKTITSQKPTSHHALVKQTSVDQASSLLSAQEHNLNQETLNLVRSMSVSEEPGTSSIISNIIDSTKSKDQLKNKSNEISSPKNSSKSFSEKYITDKFKSRKRRLTKQFSLNQPILGLVSRNCSHQFNDPNIEKRLQIFDAIATASIVANCSGLETTQRLTSITSESGNQQTMKSQLILSHQQFAMFIRNHQKENLTDEQVISLIDRHEPNFKLKSQNFLSFEGFTCYLNDKDNSAFLPQLNPVSDEDMNYPLSHYFIATSHNTYLTWYQFKGESSADMYGEVLLSGCRCVELDVWDGVDGMPMIYHGRTLVSKISFKRVVETINQFAFVTSPFPVILSIENHASIAQQIKMAKIFKETFKEKLVTDFLFESDFTETPCLPSPNQLKYRILIKNKKLKSFYNVPVNIANTIISQTQPQKQSSLPQQTNLAAASTTPTNASTLSKMGKSFPTKGFTSDRTNSLISAASTVSLNEEDFDEDDDEEVVIKQLDKLDKFDKTDPVNQVDPLPQTGSPKTPLKTTRAYSQGSYTITPATSSNIQQQQQQQKQQQQQQQQQQQPLQQSAQFFMQQSKTPYHPKVTRKSSSQVAKELSDLVIYCQAIKFRNLFTDDRLPIINNSPTKNLSSEHLSNSKYRHPNVYAGVFQVASLGENYAKKIYRKSSIQLLNYNHHNLLRVYPAPTRLQSSNFNPVLFWSFGIQLVALNYQTEDQYQAINQAMFEQTNMCGYVLKPEVMRSPNHIMYGKFNPLDSKFDGLYAVDLTIKIISGQYVCDEQYTGSPLVEVEIIGLETDCSKQRTRVIQKNSLNPIWMDSFSFRINFIDLAFLRFTVYDYASNHPTSQRIVPLKMLRTGYRHLGLRNMQNQTLPLSSLFIYSNMQEEGCLLDNLSTTTDTSNLEQINASLTMDSLFRRLVIIQLHNVRPDEPTTLVKVPQEATTIEIVLQAIHKQKHYQSSLQPNLMQQFQQIQDQLQRSTTFKQQNKTLIDAYSGLINDFVLIEEIQRQPSQSFTAAFQPVQSQRSSPATQAYSQEIKSERSQRILEADERPLEGYLPTACTNRKFILKKISDDPSCRAYISSLMKNQNKFTSNIMAGKKYDEGQFKEQQLIFNQQQANQATSSNLSPPGKRSSSSLSGSMKKDLYIKDGSDDSSDSEMSESGILIGSHLDSQIEQQQNNELLNVQLMTDGKDSDLIKGEARLITKSNNFDQWEDPIESFLVCICNVSVDQPYTILKCNVKCTSLDVINQCLIKARRQDEKSENFVLVEELINESSSTNTTFNTSFLDPLISTSNALTNLNANQQASSSNVLNCGGLSSSTYTVNTAANLSGALLNVGQAASSSQSNQSAHGLFNFNSSNCSLNRKDAAHSSGVGSINASNTTLKNTAYVRRILPDDENIYEVQRYWFGKGRFILMLKIEAIQIPSILIPENMDVNLAALEDLKERKDQSVETGKEQAKEEKLQNVSTKTLKTFKNLKNSMSMKKKEYESLPSTPSKNKAYQIKTDDLAIVGKQSPQSLRSQSVYQSPQHSLQQTLFKSTTTKSTDVAAQITGQFNRFTKHARNSLKKFNRFGTKRDKDSMDNTDSHDSSGRSSTYG